MQQRTRLFTSAVAALMGAVGGGGIYFNLTSQSTFSKDLSFHQNELLQFHRVKRYIKQAVVPPESEQPPGRGNRL